MNSKIPKVILICAILIGLSFPLGIQAGLPSRGRGGTLNIWFGAVDSTVKDNSVIVTLYSNTPATLSIYYNGIYKGGCSRCTTKTVVISLPSGDIYRNNQLKGVGSLLGDPPTVKTIYKYFVYNPYLSLKFQLPVPNPSYYVGNLQDPAYKYTKANQLINTIGVTPDDHVTIAVIDNGLRSEEWIALEDNPYANVDIIGHLSYANNQYQWITDRTDSRLSTQSLYSNHGVRVLSTLGAIAPGVKVIFIDMNEGGTENLGFRPNQEVLWQWLVNHVDTYDIDIITMSMTFKIDFRSSGNIDSLLDQLVAKRVFMLTGAGNEGTENNEDFENGAVKKYPQIYDQWYTVGSIDHWYDHAGSSVGVKSHFSSWFDATEAGNDVVNWLMPGNTIPLMLCYPDPQCNNYQGNWAFHDFGTSFAAPQIAGLAAILISRYHSVYATTSDPPTSYLKLLLNGAGSLSTFNQQMGYGFVDMMAAYVSI